MTAPSPVDLATTIVGFTVTCAGSALPPSIQIVAIDVWTGVNRLPKARLVISDGSAGEENFPVCDSGVLVPGVAITIGLGYGGNETTVFSGIVYRQGIEASVNGPPRLIVEATDKAMAMTLARGNAVFEAMTDSEVCRKLIVGAGLSAEVTATSVVQTQVQYYASAWDLLIMRAQANGMVVIARGGTVTVAPPDTGKSPVLSLTFGSSILDFRTEMDAEDVTAPLVNSPNWYSVADESVTNNEDEVTAIEKIEAESIETLVTLLRPPKGGTMHCDTLKEPENEYVPAKYTTRMSCFCVKFE